MNKPLVLRCPEFNFIFSNSQWHSLHMTLAVIGAERITLLLSLYYSMLLVIGNVRFANEISMDCLFHTTKPSIQNNLIYNMLKFHIPNTYHCMPPPLINLNICCGFLKNCGNNELHTRMLKLLDKKIQSRF